VILPEAAEGDLPAGCTVIDRRVLARTGALAVSVAADGTLTLTGARGPGRLWSGRVQEGVRLAARAD
jgi:hypothetical protein